MAVSDRHGLPWQDGIGPLWAGRSAARSRLTIGSQDFILPHLPHYRFVCCLIVVLILHAHGDGMLARRDVVQRELVIQLA